MTSQAKDLIKAAHITKADYERLKEDCDQVGTFVLD